MELVLSYISRLKDEPEDIDGLLNDLVDRVSETSDQVPRDHEDGLSSVHDYDSLTSGYSTISSSFGENLIFKKQANAMTPALLLGQPTEKIITGLN